MPSSAQRQAGYLLPDQIEGHELTCVQLMIPNAPEYRAAFLGAVHELGKWWNWDKSYTQGDTRATRAAAVWRQALQTLQFGMCDTQDCYEFGPNATFIEWFPNNPYTEPDLVGEGYLFPAWYIATPVANVVYGTASGDVITTLDRVPAGSLPTIIPASGLPRFRINVNGRGTVELHLTNIFAGSIAQITDDDDPLTATFVELTRDTLAAPPETADVIIVERTFDTDGHHHIDVIIVSSVNDQIPYIFHGGGLRKVVLCGFAGAGEQPMLIRFNQETCTLEQSANGVDYTPVAGWQAGFPPCLPTPELQLLNGTLYLVNGQDVLSEIDLESFVESNSALTYIKLGENCDLIYTWVKVGEQPNPDESTWQLAASHNQLIDCVREIGTPADGYRCNVSMNAATYIQDYLHNFTIGALEGITQSLAFFEMTMLVLEHVLGAERVENPPEWTYTAFVKWFTQINTLTGQDFNDMKLLLEEAGFIDVLREAIYCGTPNEGEIPPTWVDDIATNVIYFGQSTYDQTTVVMLADLLKEVLSLTDLKQRALIWRYDNRHELDCVYDCDPPMSTDLYALHGTLTNLGNGRYLVESVFVPDWAVNGNPGIGMQVNRLGGGCFTISNESKGGEWPPMTGERLLCGENQSAFVDPESVFGVSVQHLGWRDDIDHFSVEFDVTFD